MLMQAVETYLAVRRAADFELEAAERYLRDFARFAGVHGDRHVSAKTAIAWAGLGSSEMQRGNRLQIVIRFARFAHSDDPRHEIPPARVFCRRYCRPTPYIFSRSEIETLLIQATRLGSPGSFRSHMYTILFSLLVVTGLRISEALALRFQDVTEDGLVIRQTKFRKSRLVPVHETTAAALQRYLVKRNEVALDDDHLFVSRQRHPLSHHTVRKTFYQLLAAAAIPRRPGGPHPRLMDFRHTFATNALMTCPDDRDAIRSHMLALSTYMGHARVKNTFWYLQSTPQLLGDIASACEDRLGRTDS